MHTLGPDPQQGARPPAGGQTPSRGPDPPAGGQTPSRGPSLLTRRRLRPKGRTLLAERAGNILFARWSFAAAVGVAFHKLNVAPRMLLRKQEDTQFIADKELSGVRTRRPLSSAEATETERTQRLSADLRSAAAPQLLCIRKQSPPGPGAGQSRPAFVCICSHFTTSHDIFWKGPLSDYLQGEPERPEAPRGPQRPPEAPSVSSSLALPARGPPSQAPRGPL